MNLLIFGPQGCGKGTQAEKLSEKYNLVHIETGQLFREIAKKDTPLGKEVSNLSENKEMIPDGIMVTVLENELKKIPTEKGLILDSAPRLTSQIEIIEKMFGQLGRSVDKAISITLPREESIARINKRYICPLCNKQFVLGEGIENKNDPCPICGSPIRQRLDDTPDGIIKRLDTFQKVTVPVIEYYRGKGMLIEADGRQNADKVFENIVSNLAV
jgi:adenylate kinase